MSVTLEHDYVGLAELHSTEGADKFSHRSNDLNLKATELRLGLPGSESPERDSGAEEKNVYPLGVLKSLVPAGAKWGFSDAINGGCEKWVLSGDGKSETVFGKDGGFFFPKGVGTGKALAGPGSNNQRTDLRATIVRDNIPQSPKPLNEKKPQLSAPAAKAQVVGWPPIRSFRKNSMATQPQKNDADDAEGKSACLYVKVSLDGAPYLRKLDLKNFASYMELSSALGKMFSCFTVSRCGSHGVSGQDNVSEINLMNLLHGTEYVLTYEDKDGDWMLVGDVPWEMFIDSCKRMRIMKSSEAIGLAPRAMEKSRSRY